MIFFSNMLDQYILVVSSVMGIMIWVNILSVIQGKNYGNHLSIPPGTICQYNCMVFF